MTKSDKTSVYHRYLFSKRNNVTKVCCSRRTGFTFIEIMISILIVMTLAAGVMGYQYRSSYDVKRSEIQAAAMRISMLLLEGWKGVEGTEDFDPISMFESEIDIEESALGPAIPLDRKGMMLTLLDHYMIQMDGVYYYVTLSWEEATTQEPKLLNVVTAWRSDHDRGSLQGNEECVQFSTFYDPVH